MKYELPRNMKMSRKEEQASEKPNIRVREIAGSFLSGIFFFITIPIFFYKKTKRKNGTPP